MNLLDHPLIKKYFGLQPGEIIPVHVPNQSIEPQHWMAYKVLTAMEEPLKKEEKYLRLYRGEVEFSDDSPFALAEDLEVFHPEYLRLPDRFQPNAVNV